MNHMPDLPKVILPGGAGYLGRHLAAHLASRGWDLVVLSRQPHATTGPIRYLSWDGRALGPWADQFNGARAVINLAGRSVNCRYTAKNRAQIYESRLASTRVIGQAIARAANPPAVWLNSSSATLYRHALDRPMDETGEPGTGFSVDVCQKWEAAACEALPPNHPTRKVLLRTAMVFGPGAGGVFEAFHRIVRLGLGGTLGRGDQYVSWIHLRDFCRAIDWLIDHQELSGPVNLSSPNPLPNRDFMRAFRQVCGKRIGLPASRWMLEIGAFVLRTETELLLKSRQVVPTRLLESGFTFDFPDLRPALEDILQKQAISAASPASASPGTPVS
jgi:uncharacterized protein (TIGR01777 family)